MAKEGGDVQPPERVGKNVISEHFKMYKPPMVLCQFIHTARKRKNRRLLGEFYDFPSGTMAIGRLDEDSEGLLLLTTDGMISNAFRGNSVEKEYYCQVDGQITDEAIDSMKGGLEISVQGKKIHTLPCKCRIIECKSTCESGHPLPDDLLKPVKKIRDRRHGPTSWVSITLKEGKYRQVRKMTAKVGYPTLRLVRVRIGNINLESLKMGEVEKITVIDKNVL